MYTSHREQRTNLLMFYLSIENGPKLTTKIGLTTITGDCTNFNKYMYLCLKECNSFEKKKEKKKKPGYLKLRQPKKSNSIQTKRRRNTGL